MLHACVQRFDVTGNLKILAKFLASKRCLRNKETENRREKISHAAGSEKFMWLYGNSLLFGENLWREEFIFLTTRVKVSMCGLFISLTSWMKPVAKRGSELLG
jgi:hypothetical protein